MIINSKVANVLKLPFHVAKSTHWWVWQVCGKLQTFFRLSLTGLDLPAQTQCSRTRSYPQLISRDEHVLKFLNLSSSLSAVLCVHPRPHDNTSFIANTNINSSNNINNTTNITNSNTNNSSFKRRNNFSWKSSSNKWRSCRDWRATWKWRHKFGNYIRRRCRVANESNW